MSSPLFHNQFLFGEAKLLRTGMKQEALKQVPLGKNGKLVEVKLFMDGAYYFVYKGGTVFRLTKTDLETEEDEKRGKKPAPKP